MKVIAVNGSARAEGNTRQLIAMVGDELKKEGIDIEVVHIGNRSLRGCTACMQCWERKNEKCAIDTDVINALIEKIKTADALILGSPTYFADVSAELKAFIDRAGMVARANGDLFKRKPGAAVAAVRRAGALCVFDTINHFFLISQMIVVGSSYWNLGFGRAAGEVGRDDEGRRTMQDLGLNLAWLLKRLKEKGKE